MTNTSPSQEPRWLTPLLLLAALAACAASLAALLWGGNGGFDHHTAQVADLSFNLNGQPVREHCTSCHPQGSRSNDEGPEPHPDIAPHSVETLGCTACHLGEGMAVDREISHGLPGLGARTVLKGAELQSSCFTCHDPAPLPGAEKAWKGYQLYREKACDACHDGGRLGPDLGRVGSTLGVRNIIEAIRDPKLDPPNSIMPRYPLSRSQAKAMSYYLKSRVAEPFHKTPMMLAAAGAKTAPRLKEQSALAVMPAGELLNEVRCLACHQFGDIDGRIAPDLSTIGAMRSRKYLEVFLTNPSAKVPGAIMPQMPLDSVTRKLVLDSLVQARPQKSLPADPKHLFMQLCQRCHAAEGNGQGLIQPNLANFPRAFTGNRRFFQSIDDLRVVRSVKKGIAGTSMPPYEGLLDDQQLESLLDLIYSAFIGSSRQEKRLLPQLPIRPQVLLEEESAEVLFIDQCALCHGVAGTGKGPESLSHLPRPRNLTNHPYFGNLADQRILRTIHDGVPGTAMPAFARQFSAVELWSLVDKVRRLSHTQPTERLSP